MSETAGQIVWLMGSVVIVGLMAWRLQYASLGWGNQVLSYRRALTAISLGLLVFLMTVAMILWQTSGLEEKYSDQAVLFITVMVFFPLEIVLLHLLFRLRVRQACQVGFSVVECLLLSFLLGFFLPIREDTYSTRSRVMAAQEGLELLGGGIEEYAGEVNPATDTLKNR